MRILRSSLALAALVLLAACGSTSGDVLAPGDRAARNTDPGGATTSSDSTETRLGPGLMGSGN